MIKKDIVYLKGHINTCT